jgi:hypothetical protein
MCGGVLHTVRRFLQSWFSTTALYLQQNAHTQTSKINNQKYANETNKTIHTQNNKGNAVCVVVFCVYCCLPFQDKGKTGIPGKGVL